MPKLTDDFVAKLQVAAGKRDVLAFDSELAGFGCRKYAPDYKKRPNAKPHEGEASYFVKYTIAGQQRRLTLGPAVKGNAQKMRDRAEEVKARAKLGQDVIGEQRAKAAEQEAAETAATVGALIKVFLDDREEMTRRVNGRAPTLRESTHEQCAKYLQEHCRPLHRLVVGTVTNGADVGVVDIEKRWTRINGTKLEIVARSHVVGIIDGVAKTRGKVSADRCKTALSTFYAWAIDAGYCDINPTMNIKSRAGKIARKRVLSDQELIAIWRECPGNDFGKCVKLLMLTGQRKSEIGDLRWSEIRLGPGGSQINLPPPRVKNGVAHEVPLSVEAMAILPTRQLCPGGRDLVFGRGAGGFGGWGLAKVALDKYLGDMPHWTLHDLRRTFSTRCNELGLGPPWVIEACLNHVVGGVAGTYNRAQHEAGKREVLEKWGRYVAQLVSPQQTAKPARARRSVRQLASVTAA